jgi:dissimilatory sulfite reductase (desulfoviridin) alpha/beta subunit
MQDGQLVRDEQACLHCGDCVGACGQGAVTSGDAGYSVFVGGQKGRRPSLGRRLPFVIPDEPTLSRLLHACLDWYASNGQPRERFGRTIDRIGYDVLIAHLREISPNQN